MQNRLRNAPNLFGSLVWFLIFVGPLAAQQYTFITVDLPGSIETFPNSINTSGAVTGFYYDSNQYIHGFIRDPQGNITPFDVPGSLETLPLSINTSGAVTGYSGYYTLNNLWHGFIRDPQGNITPFDPPGSTYTVAFSINTGGAVTGFYNDSNGAVHGFIRDPQGNITSFDAPGSLATLAYSINESGAVTSSYYDSKSVLHGFIRDPQGNITPFDPPGSTGTVPLSINTGNSVTGYYTDSNGVAHGFIRDPQGNINPFDPPGSRNTTPQSINTGGAVTGHYTDSNSLSHGFTRDPQGNISPFDVPQSAGYTASYGINASGAVTGIYYSNYQDQGFIGLPQGNGVDISRYSMDVSDQSWKEMVGAGIQFVIVQGWGGISQSPYAQIQLVGDGTGQTKGAQNSGLLTGALALLNFRKSAASGKDQVDQAIAAVGLGFSNLKVMVVDVEECCSEFFDVPAVWKPLHSYNKGARVMDSGNPSHVQRVVIDGKSGSTVPNWNESGGNTPNDGSVTWLDLGVPNVISRSARINRICEAVVEIQSKNKRAAIYTDRGNWSTITGNAVTCAAPYTQIVLSKIPLWDVEHLSFTGSDGLKHCGDGFPGLQWQPNEKPYPLKGWQTRLGNQFDFGLRTKKCNGNALFGITVDDVDLDFFDPSLFQ